MGAPPELDAIYERMKSSVQEFVNYDAKESNQEPAIVDQVLVCFELVKFDSDGDVVRSINYTVASDNFSPSAYLGLAEAGRALVRQEILGWGEEEQL